MKPFLLYIDPGSGSMIVQAIIAGIIGVLFYFRTFIFKTRLFISRTKILFSNFLIQGWLHPLLVVLFFILYKIKSVIILVDIYDVLFYLMTALMVTFLIYIFLNWLLKNTIKAGIITSLFSLLVLFYQPIRGTFLFFTSVVMVILIIFLFLLITYLVSKTKRRLSVMTTYLNVLLICLVIYEGNNVVSNYHRYSSFEKFISKKQFNIIEDKIDGLPNIYHIVLDSYTSSLCLKKYFNYDNSELENFLKSKGFFIADKANNKFNSTFKSISSVFNMSYGENLDSLFRDEFLSDAIYRRNIQLGEVSKKLIEQDYKFINLSFFDIGKSKRLYDHHWVPATNYLRDILFRYSAIAPLFIHVPHYVYQADLDILNQLQKLPEGNKNKLFVYAHLMMVHGPYYFDRSGNVYENGKGPFPNDENKNYIENVMYANKQIMKTVEKIVSSKNPSIIIIQGDHGSRNFSNSKNDAEQYSIFSAYYFPDRDYAFLSDSISPVNSYRVIFNKYFHSTYKLLP